MKMNKIAIAVAMSLTIVCTSFVSPKADQQIGEPFKVHVTCYVDQGITASGEHTRKGICAMKKDWIGKTAILYLRNADGSIGEVYGIYEVLDCGGTKGLRQGLVIDVWEEDMDSAREVMKETQGIGYVQLVDAEG